MVKYPLLRSGLKTFNTFCLLVCFASYPVHSQTLNSVAISGINGLTAERFLSSDSMAITLQKARPLFSFNLNEKLFKSSEAEAIPSGNGFTQVYDGKITVSTSALSGGPKGWKCEVSFENRGKDTVLISNVVPFSTDDGSVYITGKGPWDLARAYLFRPGSRPVRVILPDNAWELGFCSFNTGNGLSVCALARRQQTTGGQKRRYETVLPPKAKVSYIIYADFFKGDWQNGLRLMFRDRYLFDMDQFDNKLFEREDLKWIKNSYIIILQMAWDREFFDRQSGKYTYFDELRKWNEQFNHIDVFCIWPTWPRLGLDQRNQWDMYRDLPGGTEQLKSLARSSRHYGTRFFISYNPWDNSTRKEDHFKGMADMIRETDADGVVLDTRGSSSYELQHTADSVKKGVIMYSEGMAIPKDMPGIISGRVHNAIYFSPELNLNKVIKPDFAIFRVCDVGEDKSHREIAISFFNGYGTELHLGRPGGRDESFRDDLNYLSGTTFILRQNNDVFLDNDWTPFINTSSDNIYVNKWQSGEKSVFTVLNMRPEGFQGKLFKVTDMEGKHFVSLWHNENIEPVIENGTAYLPVSAEGWLPSYSGTRSEASLDCIAQLPVIISSELKGDSLDIHNPGKGVISLWTGNPSYKTGHFDLKFKRDTTFKVSNIIGNYEGKIVLQYLENNLLKDENIIIFRGGKPWLISRVTPTTRAKAIPSDMVLIPKASITYNLTTREDFIPYPEINRDITSEVDSFLIDKYPVTNSQFKDFIMKSGYLPADTTNYLKHWVSGTFRQGQDKYPVVYVSYDDIISYARWAGKRLPTQAEWQLAAQGTDKRKWPWGDEFHATRCNNGFDRLTPVDAFSKGASPYGVMDLVGNVWQVTNDMYSDGPYNFMIIRGGSYYSPDSSWWYIEGGPQSLTKTQIMLMVSPGFDRCGTVGFRCVKDIDAKDFKPSASSQSQ
jgi:formylglycine-generating enzyme required for sulfatase activity